MAVSVEDVRRVATALPRSYEALVRDRVKFRVGRIVWLAFDRQEERMGFAFPKEERADLVARDPRFRLPRPSELRYHWVEVELGALSGEELVGLVEEAWAMCVPRRVSVEWFAHRGRPAQRDR